MFNFLVGFVSDGARKLGRYLAIAAFFILALMAIYLKGRKAGSNEEKLKQEELENKFIQKRIEELKEAKNVADSVNKLDNGDALDKLRKSWNRDKKDS